MGYVIISDSFTESTTDTELSAHTPVGGDRPRGTWAKAVVTNDGYADADDYFRGDSTSVTAIYVNSIMPPLAEVDVFGGLWRASTSNYLNGFIARLNGTSYIQGFLNNSAEVAIQEVVSGTVSGLITQGGLTIAANTTYNCSLEVRTGTNGIKLYNGATLWAQLTCDEVTAPGFCGVRARSNSRVYNWRVEIPRRNATLPLTGVSG